MTMGALTGRLGASQRRCSMRYLCFILCLLSFFSVGALEILTDAGLCVPPAEQILHAMDIKVPKSFEEMPDLIKTTQKCFVQKNKERWQFSEVVVSDPEALRHHFYSLGCFEAVKAQKRHYKYAILLGALRQRMQERLDFLFSEWKRGVRFDAIVLLSGKRELDKERESPPKGVHTEAELFSYLFKQHPLASVSTGVRLSVVDANKVAGINRPTTLNTFHTWLESEPTPGTCLVISNQPYVGYQEAVARYSLHGSGMVIEGVGDKAEKVSPAILLDTFAKWLNFAFLYYEKTREGANAKAISEK